jgi:hypothetical protein
VGQVREVLPAALIAGITFADRDALDGALEEMGRTFGPVETRSAEFAFDMTDYYVSEMGEGLRKLFVCFSRPIRLDDFPPVKLRTNDIERVYSRDEGTGSSRRVNIDPGYVTLSKLVLATTKDFSHRVYIGSGIYAETTLRFIGGVFVPFDTTYPDYRTKPAIEFFNQVREFVKRNGPAWTRETASMS